jgi:gas vesicle protein
MRRCIGAICGGSDFDYDNDAGALCILLFANPTGVKVRRFVRAIRETLARAEDLIKNSRDNMMEVDGYRQIYDTYSDEKGQCANRLTEMRDCKVG